MQDTPPEASQGDSVDQSRRRPTGAALRASAIFTLASRPVWASQCSISGMASGNLSNPREALNNSTWPSLRPRAKRGGKQSSVWLRMPAHLLIPHLFQKAFVSPYQHAPKAA
ncbi:MAG TPA: hypothetical protein VMV78_01575 [Thiobacillus sp.]|nr:hypothetical protein [Thiobacillus sp.]